MKEFIFSYKPKKEVFIRPERFETAISLLFDSNLYCEYFILILFVIKLHKYTAVYGSEESSSKLIIIIIILSKPL